MLQETPAVLSVGFWVGFFFEFSLSSDVYVPWLNQ